MSSCRSLELNLRRRKFTPDEILSRKLEYEILAVHTTQSREMTAGAGQTVKQKKAFKKVL